MGRGSLVFVAACKGLPFLLFACGEPEPPDPGREGGPVADGSVDAGALEVYCEVTVRASGLGNPARVAIAGEWNGWSPDLEPLVDDDGDGSVERTLRLRPGRYAYKFVVDGAWIFDPSNPLTTWSGEFENSLLRVPDCRLPTLTLASLSFEPGATVVAEVRANDGILAAGLDPASLRVTLDGEVAGAGLVDDRIEIRSSGLPLGKHTFRFSIADHEGRSARDRVVPFWIEEEPFEWSDAILYFVMTDRFRNGDPTNDAPIEDVPAASNYQGGDLAGVLSALEDGTFDELGVRALWLTNWIDNPNLAEVGSDGRLYSGYHGYWPADPFTIEEHFGDESLLRDVIERAHERGIRVVMDVVFNHVWDGHPYFREHRPSGWFNGDGSCVCDTCGWDSHPIDCWFTPYLPDLNWAHQDVVDTLVDDALTWALDFGVDGFRLDAVKHMQHIAGRTFSVRLREELRGTNAAPWIVGETFTGEEGRAQISEYIGPHELDGQFDFPLYWATLRVLGRREGSLSDLDAAVLAGERDYPEGSLMSPFLGNHDVARILSHAAGDISDLWGTGAREEGWLAPPVQPAEPEPYQRLAEAFLFLLTQPGVPLIYYGDEVGLAGAGDPDNRRRMPGADTLSAPQESLRAHVSLLGQARRQHRALRRGTRRTLWVDDELYVWARHTQTEVALSVLYLGSGPRTVDIPIPPDVPLSGGMVLRDVLGGDAETASADSLTLHLTGPRSALLVP